MSLLDYLKNDDKTFWEDYEALLAHYRYQVENNPDYNDSILEDWIKEAGRQLNKREIIKKLKGGDA